MFSVQLSAQVSVNESGEVELVPTYKLHTPHNIKKYSKDKTVVFVGGKGQLTRSEAAKQRDKRIKTGKKLNLGNLKQAAKEQGIEVPSKLNNVSELINYLAELGFDFSKLLD